MARHTPVPRRLTLVAAGAARTRLVFRPRTTKEPAPAVFRRPNPRVPGITPPVVGHWPPGRGRRSSDEDLVNALDRAVAGIAPTPAARSPPQRPSA